MPGVCTRGRLSCWAESAEALAALHLQPSVTRRRGGEEEADRRQCDSSNSRWNSSQAACQEVGAKRPERREDGRKQQIALVPSAAWPARRPRCGGGEGGSGLGLEEGQQCLSDQRTPVSTSPREVEAPRCPGRGPRGAESGFKP